MNEEKKPVEQMTYREAVTELERIADALDGNELELEERLSCFERGVALLKAVQVMLTEAQQKIDVLQGEFVAEPDDAVRDTSLS